MKLTEVLYIVEILQFSEVKVDRLLFSEVDLAIVFADRLLLRLTEVARSSYTFCSLVVVEAE